MCEETKKLENLENTELTDEQTENISGGLQPFIESSNNDAKIISMREVICITKNWQYEGVG